MSDTTERDDLGLAQFEQAAVNAIVRAIRNEGPAPWYHRQTMNRHRQEWPTLWRALDMLLASREEVDG